MESVNNTETKTDFNGQYLQIPLILLNIYIVSMRNTPL